MHLLLHRFKVFALALGLVACVLPTQPAHALQVHLQYFPIDEMTRDQLAYEAELTMGFFTHLRVQRPEDTGSKTITAMILNEAARQYTAAIHQGHTIAEAQGNMLQYLQASGIDSDLAKTLIQQADHNKIQPEAIVLQGLYQLSTESSSL
ncbi:MAG: hypothetical protein KTR14_03020 [Vampirovibrio sp.]|nr:hypothetical protein [Vampirovibrio sp.]